MNGIFLSYSSKDREFVSNIACNLLSNNFPVWFDIWNMELGDSLLEMINSGITNSFFLILFMSKSSMKSKWVRKELKSALSERKHSSINKIFNSIIKEVLNANAVISLSINRNGNIDFHADYQNPTDLLKTSESQGTTYKKLLCVAFDLSLLINYSKNSFYKFVYHDGVLEGIDDRIKVRFINLVKSLSQKYDLQYILTLIDSDLPKGYPNIINEEDICLKLNDKDNTGKLFLHSF